MAGCQSKANANGDFQIKLTDDHAPANLVKANKRMLLIVEKHSVDTTHAAARVPSDQIGASPLNRMTNIPYVHQLGADLRRDGFDPSRCQKGWLRRLKSQAKIDALVKHNEEIGGGTDLLPPVLKGVMVYECLATTHMSTALALFRTGRLSLITGEVWSVPLDDALLREVVELGHFYYILDEDLPDDDAEFLITW